MREAAEQGIDGASVCVTGAAGFIGSHLCDRLLARGCRVVGIDSFEEYYDPRLKRRNIRAAVRHPNFELLDENLISLASSGGAIANVLGSADVIFHLAAQAGVRASWGTSFRTYVDNNVYATQLLLEAAREGRPRKIVYASSSSVYGNSDSLPLTEDQRCVPVSPYGVTKLACEHLCATYEANFGLPTVSLRFFTVYGPRQRPDMGFHKFIKAVLSGQPIRVYGDGLQTRDFTYVDDIVDALLAASLAPSGIVVNVGGGSSITLTGALDLIGELTGCAPEIQYGPFEPGDVLHTSASLDLAHSLLAYRPKTSLREGLRAEVDWLREAIAEELL